MRNGDTAEPLRILVVSERYPPHHVGGYEIACQRTCELLGQRGHAVHVLTSTWGLKGRRAEHGVSRVLRRLPPEGLATATPTYFVKQAWRAMHLHINASIAVRFAREYTPDIVFIWQSEGIGIGTAVALGRAGFPVIHRRDDEALADLLDRLRCERNPIWRRCRSVLYGVSPGEVQSAQLIVISSSLRERYVAAGFAPERIVIVPNGVPTSVIVCARRANGTGSPIQLLYAGRICREKGVHIAIQALALIRQHRPHCFHLDIVGLPEELYFNDLKQLVHSLDLNEEVAFFGARPPSDMYELYDRYDALLFPSIVREGFGLTLIEAMARGLAVIAVDRGGPRDIINSGIDGLLVTPEDPGALAAAVLDMFGNPSLLLSMRNNALDKIRRKFTLEESVRCIERTLSEQVSTS